MALYFYNVRLMIQFRASGLIGPDKTRSLLEFGEQNWFGDIPAEELQSLIEQFWTDEASRSRLQSRLGALRTPSRQNYFDLAKLFYEILLGEHRYRAIDLHGTEIAEKCDLNLPLPFDEQFDIVTNFGTAEHVFDVRQVFESIHRHTRPGGFMLHALPNQGCYDHGLFNFQPTFVFDLAHANGYDVACLLYCPGLVQPPKPWFQIRDRADYVRLVVEGKLSDNSYLMAVLRKGAAETPFRNPMQAFYDNRLPPDLAEAWQKISR